MDSVSSVCSVVFFFCGVGAGNPVFLKVLKIFCCCYLYTFPGLLLTQSLLALLYLLSCWGLDGGGVVGGSVERPAACFFLPLTCS